MKKILLSLVLCGVASVSFADQPLILNKTPPSALVSKEELSPRLQALKESLNRKASNSFLGLNFAEEITLTECEKQKIGKKMVYKHVANSAPCIEYPDVGGQPLPRDYQATIIFPYKDASLRIKGNEVFATIVDGKLEGITFPTSGLSTHKYLFAEMKEKYGQPTSLVPQVMTNGFGAKFEAVSALWMFSNIVVNYESAVGKIDSGRVDIYTSIGTKNRSNEIKKVLGEPKPL